MGDFNGGGLLAIPLLFAIAAIPSLLSDESNSNRSRQAAKSREPGFSEQIADSERKINALLGKQSPHSVKFFPAVQNELLDYCKALSSHADLVDSGTFIQKPDCSGTEHPTSDTNLILFEKLAKYTNTENQTLFRYASTNDDGAENAYFLAKRYKSTSEEVISSLNDLRVGLVTLDANSMISMPTI